jgi:DNA polymerase I
MDEYENRWDRINDLELAEKEILKHFIDDWRRINPDVVVHYNGKFFDLPVVIERCRYHDLPTDWVNRDDSKLKEDDSGRIHRIHGRINFDVWEQVDSDQTMGGIKNRRLKTVAAWFGIPLIEEELSSTCRLLENPERLEAYCSSDVNITNELYQIYLHGLVIVANELQFPYDQIVNPAGSKGKKASKHGRAREGTSVGIGRLVCGRGMVQGGFVEDGQNRQRYPTVYSRQDDGKKNYQGAIVDIEKTGVFTNILHMDFSGMYPSIQMSINISVETTRLVAMEPYDPEADLVRERGDGYTIFCIPDDKLEGQGRNAVIYVDQKIDGELPRMLRHLKASRDDIKKNLKVAKKAGDKDSITKYNSQQYGLKVVGNACGYGANAPAEVRYGSFAVAMLITGIGRYMLQKATRWILDNTSLEVIERDTDGIYFDNVENEDPDKIVKATNDFIAEETSRWGISADMKMDATVYPAGYFYKKKSYVLRKEDGGLKITGIAFKGSDKPPLFDDCLMKFAEMKLRGAPESEVRDVIKTGMRIENWPLPALIKRRQITKRPHQYKKGDLGRRLALMAEDLLGTPAEPYTQYEYVYCKGEIRDRPPEFKYLDISLPNEERIISDGGFMLAALARHSSEDEDPIERKSNDDGSVSFKIPQQKSHIDFRRYREIIAGLCDRFGWGDIAEPFVRNPGITPVEGWY